MSKTAPTPNVKHKCAATTATGRQCQRYALAGGEFCYHHSETNAAAIAAAGSKGGSVPRKPIIPMGDAMDGEKARKILSGVLAELLAGNLSEGIARSVGYLLQIDCRLREAGDHEARIAQLEAAVKENKL